MNGVGIIGAIVIGIFAGWLAEQIMGRKHGIVTNLIVGLVGSFIGAFLARAAGIDYGGWISSLIASVLGACLLLFLLGLIKRPAR